MDGWSDLPEELLGKMVEVWKCDAHRCRAVCRSWQSSIQNPNPKPRRLSFPLPSCHECSSKDVGNHFKHKCIEKDSNFTVEEFTVRRFDPLRQNPNPKIRKRKRRRRYLPSSSFFLERPCEQNPNPNLSPHCKNLLDFRVSHITTFYATTNWDCSHYYHHEFIDKVVINGAGDVMVTYSFDPNDTGCLLYLLRSGDKEWTEIGFHIAVGQDFTELIKNDDEKLDPYYEELIAYKEKFYAVKDDGTAIVIDPRTKKWSQVATPIPHHQSSSTSTKWSQVATPIPRHQSSSTSTALVESLEHLLLVNRNTRPNPQGEEVDYFRVYKLDEEARRWIRTKSLGGQALLFEYGPFVNNYNRRSNREPPICVTACDSLIECKEDHIYYAEDCTFNLRDGSIIKE